MSKTKTGKMRNSRTKEDQQLRAIYAKSRRDFSAAHLQKFTVVEKGIPLERVIADMERIQKQQKPKKR